MLSITIKIPALSLTLHVMQDIQLHHKCHGPSSTGINLYNIDSFYISNILVSPDMKKASEAHTGYPNSRSAPKTPGSSQRYMNPEPNTSCNLHTGHISPYFPIQDSAALFKTDVLGEHTETFVMGAERKVFQYTYTPVDPVAPIISHPELGISRASGKSNSRGCAAHQLPAPNSWDSKHLGLSQSMGISKGGPPEAVGVSPVGAQLQRQGELGCELDNVWELTEGNTFGWGNTFGCRTEPESDALPSLPSWPPKSVQRGCDSRDNEGVQRGGGPEHLHMHQSKNMCDVPPIAVNSCSSLEGCSSNSSGSDSDGESEKENLVFKVVPRRSSSGRAFGKMRRYFSSTIGNLLTCGRA